MSEHREDEETRQSAILQNSHLVMFEESLNRCFATQDFIPKFYNTFLDTSQEVRALFARVPLHEQYGKFGASLRTLSKSLLGDHHALIQLNEVAERHSRIHANIRPDLYVLWKNSLMSCAESSDPDWSPVVAAAWESTLDTAIEFMVRRF